MKPLFILIYAFIIVACANITPTNSKYKQDCFERSWNCHKLTNKEKHSLLQELSAELEFYSNYFENRNTENINKGINKFVYWEAEKFCRKIFLIDDENTECSNIHQYFSDSVKVKRLKYAQ